MPELIDDKNPETAIALGIACAVGFVIGFVAFTFKGQGAMEVLWDAAGPLTFFMLFLILPALYYIYNGQELFRFRAEFNELIVVKSKARFLSKIDRIEYLAWKLGREYSNAVQEKRKELGIKRKSR